MERNNKGQFIEGVKMPKEWIIASYETRKKEWDLNGRKGHEQNKETRKKISKNNARYWLGKKRPNLHTKENREKSRKRMKEHPIKYWLGKKGEKHHSYIKNRSLLKKHNKRNDVAYRDWRITVLKRDNYECRIKDNDCKGIMEIHHILPWRDYPELRYIINNGITLCHAHHPKKRAKEQLLAPTFQELISQMN